MWKNILAVAVMCGCVAVFADEAGAKKDVAKAKDTASGQSRDMAGKGYEQAARIKHEAATPCPNHPKQGEAAKAKDSCEKGIVKKASVR